MEDGDSDERECRKYVIRRKRNDTSLRNTENGPGRKGITTCAHTKQMENIDQENVSKKKGKEKDKVKKKKKEEEKTSNE